MLNAFKTVPAQACTAVAAATVLASAAACHLYRRGRRQRDRGTHKEDAAERDARLREVLAPSESGLTVYWAGESPCARRVLISLREKGLQYKNCVISLLHGEQRHPAFLEINPQGKVPVLVCQGIEGVEDCTIFESAAIVTWLDEAFPETKQLLPSLPSPRRQARLWQYWELCIAEEFWPLSRMQVDGVLWRWGYSPQEFNDVKQVMGGGDPFYTSKIQNICSGTFLTPEEMLSHQIRISRGFAMLEQALSSGKSFLVDDAFSIADISVLPRLLKAPINGVLATKAHREQHKHVCAYFDSLRARQSLLPFRRPDDAAWSSGSRCYILSMAGFGPRWLDGLPWWFLVLVGNWRHRVNFERVSFRDVSNADDPRLLTDVLHAIPLPRQMPVAKGEQEEWLLYGHDALPLCTAVRIVMDTLGGDTTALRTVSGDTGKIAFPRLQLNFIDYPMCQNFCKQYLELMPWGELPALVDCKGESVYGPMNIVDFACERAAESGRPLMPRSPKVRAIVRRWAGWARTSWHYQLMPLYWQDVAGPALCKAFGSDRSALSAGLVASIGDADRLEVDAGIALRAYDSAQASIIGATTDAQQAYGANSESELMARCRYVDDELRKCAKSGGKFLAGGSTPSVADAFVAPVVEIAITKYIGSELYCQLDALRAWITDLKQNHPAFRDNCAALVKAWGEEPVKIV